jgi:demethylmenaquinone methyltransferase/2-methoxy-6-polyprenyl-1,4-benzoquinol methylase
VYLDVCAGTLDVSAELARRPGFRGTVLAADFAEPMLRRGLAKVKGSAVRPVVGDALQLPVADRRVAGAIVAFGARNFHDLDAGLTEMYRALARGARLVILDFSCPSIAPVRALYNAYFHGVLPRVGALISGHRTAYRYLPESVANFPGAAELARRMEHAGFARVEHRTLTMGIAAIHWGERAA